jgi:molybdopterin/thiamine biosynthesis adenylyltransferase
MDRYHRQTLLPFVGSDGQAKLGAASVLLVGCGALGSVIADQLVRAGIGHLRLVDRDVVELTNLQRQVLFDESDARDGVPKAVAAAKRLKGVNSAITIEAVVADVHSGNIEEFSNVDLILDGSDNVETRYLINDVAVKKNVPWVYGACVGTEGRVMLVRPGVGPCLRCVFPNPPEAGELPTCDTAGVLGPAAAIVASMQTIAAIQFLTGQPAGSNLIKLDVWTNRFRTIDTGGRRADCECCGQRRFVFLDRPVEQSAVRLCGRNAVQIHWRPSTADRLPELARRLMGVGEVQQSPFLVRCQLADEKLLLTVFADGRTIVQGTNDIGRARSIVSRYIGS